MLVFVSCLVMGWVMGNQDSVYRLLRTQSFKIVLAIVFGHDRARACSKDYGLEASQHEQQPSTVQSGPYSNESPSPDS